MSEFFKGLLIRSKYIYVLPNYNEFGETEKGFGIWLWIGRLDDFFFTSPDLAQEHNHKRMRRLSIQFTLAKWTLYIDIPYRRIGNKIGRRKR